MKGEPHYAALLAWTSLGQEAAAGRIDVRWCVFFPVGKQPPGVTSVALPTIRRAITLNLHGFFFLDSERLRIDGLDEEFRHNGATATGVCVEWNRTLASRGALGILPDTFAAFARREQLPEAQCRELASAFQQTQTWVSFRQTICQSHAWRPRWWSGKETWELLSTDDDVFLIPRISDAAPVLARIPKLAALSQQVALVTVDGNGDLPGLHDGKVCAWPESLVLQLLDGVELPAAGEPATAEWLDAFLTQLHKSGSLTAAIRERVAQLPLLPVRVSRTGAHRRINPNEWDAAIASGALFGPSPQTEIWLRLLHPALAMMSFG
ncbi:MAG: hypothetical protein QM813_17595 [Verrucomicrobiota bacterium]